MKKLFFSIFALLITLFLVGCETNPSRQDPVPPTAVKKTKTVVVKVPQELLVRCKATHPPERQLYAAADIKGREDLLTAYSRELVTIIKNCDKTITTIDKWGTDQEKLLLETNDQP